MIIRHYLKNIVIVSMFFSISCSEPEKAKRLDSDLSADESHQNDSTSIQLNNGEKWKVDENMLKYIKQMESDLINFDGQNQNDYKLLSEKLQNNVDLLTSNCTMTGQAHDELHKWLLPYIDAVKSLSESVQLEDSKTKYQVLKSSFNVYHQYFE